MAQPPLSESDWPELPVSRGKKKTRILTDCAKSELSPIFDGLTLEEADSIPVSEGWGYCLLGFFAGNFPGKETVTKFTTKRWQDATVYFHSKGWILFVFASEKDKEAAVRSSPHIVSGIKLILGSLPDYFRFDSPPSVEILVWASLPNLPLELWNKNALGKLASYVGRPLEFEMDPGTSRDGTIDCARLKVAVDATKDLPLEVRVRLHDGTSFSQKIDYDYVPKYCERCSRFGHLGEYCTTAD